MLMGFICLFIPSEAKDVAKQKHEFVKKVEKEQEKIAKAKKVLDKEMAKGKISKESRKKLEESIKTAQKDMKQARSVDEVTAAQKRRQNFFEMFRRTLAKRPQTVYGLLWTAKIYRHFRNIRSSLQIWPVSRKPLRQ